MPVFAIARTDALKQTMVAAESFHGDSMIGEKPHMNKRSGLLLFAAVMAPTMVVGGCSKSPEATATTLRHRQPLAMSLTST